MTKIDLAFHFKKREYIEGKGFGLISSVISRPVEKAESGNYSSPGFLQHKEIIELGEVKNLKLVQRDSNNRYSSKFLVLKEVEIGLNEKGFRELYDLAKQILKEPSFRDYVSEAFLVDLLFDWVMENYRQVTGRISLADHIIEKATLAIESYNVYVPILFLESNREIDLGFVQFKYLAQQYIEALAFNVEETRRDGYISSLSKYRGQLFGTCTVIAEKIRAIEKASERIIVGVDILRICSPVVPFPELRIYYDVDFRNSYQLKRETLVQLTSKAEDISLTSERCAVPFVIDDSLWNIMASSGLGIIREFLEATFTKTTELQSLIRNAIANFSRAIANIDLHERIIRLFTVLESLLLLSEDVSILDSVTKYLPKLITSDVEERKEIVDAVKKLYQVRSALVHHGRNKEFEMPHLAMLQCSCYSLILRMIMLSKSKSTKQEILKDIDDRIMSA
jgi:hypothetical protein